jgi:hypothetical protein
MYAPFIVRVKEKSGVKGFHLVMKVTFDMESLGAVQWMFVLAGIPDRSPRGT